MNQFLDYIETHIAYSKTHLTMLLEEDFTEENQLYYCYALAVDEEMEAAQHYLLSRKPFLDNSTALFQFVESLLFEVDDAIKIVLLEQLSRTTKNKWILLELFNLLKEIEPYKAWGYLEEALLIDPLFHPARWIRILHLDPLDNCVLVINETLLLPQTFVNEEVLARLSLAYYNNNDIENSLKTAKGSLEIQNNFLANFILGLIHEEHLDDLELGLEYLNEALQMEREHPQALVTKAWILFDLTRYAEAEEVFLDLIRVNNIPESYSQLIQFYIRIHEINKAKTHITASNSQYGAHFMIDALEIIVLIKQSLPYKELLSAFKTKYSSDKIEWFKMVFEELSMNQNSKHH